jgi:hypothetical protein
MRKLRKAKADETADSIIRKNTVGTKKGVASALKPCHHYCWKKMSPNLGMKATIYKQAHEKPSYPVVEVPDEPEEYMLIPCTVCFRFTGLFYVDQDFVTLCNDCKGNRYQWVNMY